MTTLKLYLEDSDLSEATAKIVELINGEQPIIRLDRTIFHAQGGGQKSDIGLIDNILVTHASHSDNYVDHYVADFGNLEVGQEVNISIDINNRLIHAKHHVAGHLIAALIEKRFPDLQATGGHHWPGQARVEFSGTIPPIEKVQESLKSDLAEAIFEDIPVQVKGDPYGSRKIAIGDFPAVSCGGTHPKSLGTLREVEVTKIKSQKGVLRVSYSVAN